MSKKTTIFYLIDGAKPDVMQSLLDAGELPNIKNEILSEGTFRKATTCFPSTTGPAYLPFLTGRFPGAMEVPGIRWFDKLEFKRKRYKNRDAIRSYCGPEANWFIDDFPKDTPTLLELFDDSYNIFSMFTRGIPEERDLGKKGKSLLYLKAHFLHWHHKVDHLAHQHLMHSLTLNPEFVFVVFPSVDWDSHSYHPEDKRTIESYKYVDQSVGEVVKYLKENNKWDDTLLMMTSDHGLTSTHTHFDLSKFFKKHGFKALEHPNIWRHKPDVAVMISGNSFGSVHVLKDSDQILFGDEVIDAIGQSTWNELLNNEAVDFVSWRGQNNECLVESNKGKAKICKQEDKLNYVPITGDPLGLGKLEEFMDAQESLEKTFNSDYPDGLVQINQLFGSQRAGDFIVSATPGYDLRSTWEIPEHKGSHGSLHREHLHVPLIYNQKNWNPKAARTSDIFYSILDWMGKPSETKGDGISLLNHN